jgi:hypothetical protein
VSLDDYIKLEKKIHELQRYARSTHRLEYKFYSVRDYEKRKARNTIIILTCIVCASAILLAAVFGTLATKLYDTGKVAANTIDEIYAVIALLRNETETRLDHMLEVVT